MEQQFNQTFPEVPQNPPSHSPQDSQVEIRAVMEGVQAAYRAGDVDKIMSYYAPDIVAFDMAPPLALKGIPEYRRAWQMGIDALISPGEMETTEDKYYVSGDLGVVHNLCHLTGTLKGSGQKMDSWSRYTGVFKKMGGKWLIVHEQFSVPIDMEREKPLWDLKPGGNDGKYPQ